MKRLLIAFLVLAVMTGCSKSFDTVIPNSNTATDAVNKPGTASSKSVSYKFYYNGNADAQFIATFPKFNSATGTMTSWRLTVDRNITGFDTLINQLTVKNDSSIVVQRYLEVYTFGDFPPIALFPYDVVDRINNILPANRTEKIVSINQNLTDIINSDGPAILQGFEGPLWVVRDVVTVFKPNCVNNFDLKDDMTLTLTYFYVNN